MRTLLMLTCCGAIVGACSSTGNGSRSGSSDNETTTDGGAAADGGGETTTDGTEDGGDTGTTDGGDTGVDGGTVDGGTATGAVEPTGLALLGNGKNSVNFVVLEEVAGPGDGLSVPRDVEVNPFRPNELWTVNTQSESVVVIYDAGTTAQSTETFWSLGSHHFMGRPAALAFGANDSMATIHDTAELTQGPNGTPADFMGPTLHATHNLNLFDAGHGSHLDMLHNSPSGVGIAWESDNIYWVLDGFHSSVTRYDFASDHGMGGADHSDGSTARCAEGEVTRVDGSVSHLAMDTSTGLLYIADTGNNRIAVLDTNTGTKGGSVAPNYDGVAQYRINDVVIETLVDGSDHDMSAPAGLELHDGMIWVTDSVTSRVHAFDMDGQQVDWMDTYLDAGSLQGLAFDDAGHMFLTDAVRSRIYQISALSD
ncbi:MAG: hypothetical protein ACI9WU_000753 [Myxococcota bacterium]